MLDIVIAIIAIILVIAMSIYFYIDMKDHKTTNTTEFEYVKKNIEDEEKTRLGNIKYVVEQVNLKNQAIDTEYNARFNTLEDNVLGFGKLIKTENGTKSISEVAYPQSIDLMKRVSVIGGMTIKDLQKGTSFKACGKDSNVGACIEFPNSDGDTVLKGITGPTSSVISESHFKALAGATITASNLEKIHMKADDSEIILTPDGSAFKDSTVLIKSGNTELAISSVGINIMTGAMDQKTSEYPIRIDGIALKGFVPKKEDDDAAFIASLRGKNLLHL